MRRQILALDSGIGGLGIVGALRRAVPDAAIAFVADHGFFPYGERADADLVAHLDRLLDRLIARIRPDIVVIACNTASTIALAPLRDRFPDQPFVGCVPPVKWAAAVSRSRTIGLLATGATVRRDYVRDLQRRFAPDCRLVSHGAPGLAALAERRFRGETLPPRAIDDEIAPLFASAEGAAIDVVCLGCTHYGLLLAELRDRAPRPVAWLDPAEAVARRAAAVLAASGPGRTDAIDAAFTTAGPAGLDAFRRGLAPYGYVEASSI